jgi:hypothetical protein
MREADLETGLKSLTGLLEEFRKGNIARPTVEAQVMGRHTRELSDKWDQRFPGFPQHYFPFTSFWGEHYRGKRDQHLRSIIVRLVAAYDRGNKTIVNPACAAARHARDLAARLPDFRVIATDINPWWNWFCERLVRRSHPANFEFIKDNIFEPTLEAIPVAVVFFGACGAVSDGAIDYAINSHSRFLVCRTCCHDNIGGNTEIVRRPGLMNWFFRFKNREFSRIRKKEKYAGFYFSDNYGKKHYPTSRAAKGLTSSDEFMAVARNSVDSDVCRAIIDLDRYLRLVEAGYEVCYRGELFVAESTSAV